MPAVSVIMAAYNVEPYLDAAIASVRAQTWRDFELLIVDDGSTDGSLAIAERHAQADPRIRVLRKPNGGISSARNHGLRATTAPVIALLDSDDSWLPEYLEAQLAILAAHPGVDIVTGNAWFLGGCLDGQPARPSPDPRPAPDLAEILADETAVFIMSIFRRRVYETIGGFDEALRTNEDYDFWLRAAVAGFRFHRNDRPLGCYRRRDDSLSSSELRMLRGLMCVYQKLRPSLAERRHELQVLDTQLSRFETERCAAEARQAIESGDFAAAGGYLAELHQRRGGAALGVARLMARWTPSLLAMAYNMRRARIAPGGPAAGRA